MAGTYVCTLSDKLQKKAEKELNEKPSRRNKDIEALRDMVLAHPGLKCPTDDAFLLKFLRARKFNIDKAYNLILSYYTVRAEYHDIFQNALPSKCQHLMDARVMTMLPNRDKEGRRIGIFRPGKYDPEFISEKEIVNFNILQLDKIVRDEETQVNGVVFIGEMSGLTMAHVKAFSLETTPIMPTIIQDAFPVRLKAVHMCHEPSIFGMAWGLISPFIKEKMSKRMNFNGTNLKKLHSDVGVENLPEELGGNLGPLDKLADVWYEELKKDEEYFKEMLQYKIELTKPITKKKNEEVVEVLMGTYKKLNVD